MEGGKLEIEVMQADKVGHRTYHTVSQAVFKTSGTFFIAFFFFSTLTAPHIKRVLLQYLRQHPSKPPCRCHHPERHTGRHISFIKRNVKDGF